MPNGSIVARVKGGDEHYLLLRGDAPEIEQFAKCGGRRLFEQHVSAGEHGIFCHIEMCASRPRHRDGRDARFRGKHCAVVCVVRAHEVRQRAARVDCGDEAEARGVLA
jgi:hypothetical protein